MIIIKPGINSCVFTLNEKFDFFNPSPSLYPDLYYFFRLTNSLNGSEVVFTSNKDDSLYPNRYNQFDITVAIGTQSTDPHNAIIGLTGPNEDYLSQWTYEVWACSGPMPLSGTISLPISGSYSPVLIEGGRALYKI
jgi:hypothetical protein